MTAKRQVAQLLAVHAEDKGGDTLSGPQQHPVVRDAGTGMAVGIGRLRGTALTRGHPLETRMRVRRLQVGVVGVARRQSVSDDRDARQADGTELPDVQLALPQRPRPQRRWKSLGRSMPFGRGDVATLTAPIQYPFELRENRDRQATKPVGLQRAPRKCPRCETCARLAAHDRSCNGSAPLRHDLPRWRGPEHPGSSASLTRLAPAAPRTQSRCFPP